MKMSKFFTMILVGVMMVSVLNIKAEQQQDWQVKLSQAMPFQLEQLGLWSLWRYFMYGEVVGYLKDEATDFIRDYKKLLLNKTSNEQLRILTDAKASINMFTSPLKYIHLNGLITLYNSTQDHCWQVIKETQNPDDQIKKLEEYKDRCAQLFPDFNSSFDESFIDGFIKQIQEKL